MKNRGQNVVAAPIRLRRHQDAAFFAFFIDVQALRAASVYSQRTRADFAAFVRMAKRPIVHSAYGQIPWRTGRVPSLVAAAVNRTMQYADLEARCVCMMKTQCQIAAFPCGSVTDSMHNSQRVFCRFRPGVTAKHRP